jgi:anti-anti-sigma factor
MMTDERPVIVLKGDFGYLASHQMRDVLAELAEPATIDLTQVQHLDATALGMLAAVARRVGLGQLTLIVPRGSLTRLMKMVGFANLCTVITDRRETPSLGSRLMRRSTDRAQTASA